MDRLQQQLRALGHEWSAPIPVPVQVPEVESTPVPVVRVQNINADDWTRSFALDSGAVFRRTSDRIYMRIGSNNISARVISLGRGSNTFGLIAPVDFMINLQMSQEEFRRALSIIGRIVSES